MRDDWGESLDVYSPYASEARRWRRYERESPPVSGSVLLAVAASLLLLAFVAEDVNLYQSQSATVRVTAVEWFIPGAPLTTSAGFSMHSSDQVALTLTCNVFCYRFSGATVESPFTLVSFAAVDQPTQYVNVTVQSPPGSYSGPIAIVLNLG
jgi:hypothetical protein